MVEEVEERSPSPERERGVRWNDPRFAIAWPAEPRVISDKDAQRRDFDPACIWQAEGRRVRPGRFFFPLTAAEKPHFGTWRIPSRRKKHRVINILAGFGSVFGQRKFRAKKCGWQRNGSGIWHPVSNRPILPLACQRRGDRSAFGDIDLVLVTRQDRVARRPGGTTYLAADLPTRTEDQDFHFKPILLGFRVGVGLNSTDFLHSLNPPRH